MGSSVKILSLFFLFNWFGHCLSQDNNNELPLLDPCKDFRAIEQASFPFDVNTNLYYPDRNKVRLSTDFRKVVSLAELVPLNEGECPSGLFDPELIPILFDTLETYSYDIMRLIPSNENSKDMGIFVISTSDYWTSFLILLTYRLNDQSQDCIEIINTMVVDFTMGNNHWGHSRSVTFTDENNIEIRGGCWHESNEEENTSVAIVSIATDGTMEVNEITTE